MSSQTPQAAGSEPKGGKTQGIESPGAISPGAISPGAISPGTETRTMRHELAGMQHDWWWFLVLGIALVTLGVVAIGSAFFVSIVTVVMFGVLLVIGGVGQVISSFWAGKWGGFLLHLLVGILYLVVGVLIIDAPLESTLALTLLVAAGFMMLGIFRIIAALSLRFHQWGWPLLNGFVTLLLGILIYKQWPASGLWVIGLFVGIEMIFNGVTWVMLAYDVRRSVARRIEAVASGTVASGAVASGAATGEGI